MNAVAAAPASSASISLRGDLATRWVLRLADTCLVHAQRLAEWSGHAPVIEEDIALSNLALDLLGQARALLTRAGQLDGQGLDEDQLAFLREERQFYNLTLVELPMRRSSAHSPGGDFADAVLRNLFVAAWLGLHWQHMLASSDDELAGIAAKALKEARYHRAHAADWVVRLGDGTAESAARLRAALERHWPHVEELFVDDETDAHAAANGLGPRRSALRDAWMQEIGAVFAQAMLELPAPGACIGSGSRGVHSEHLGFMLAEMQYLQRAFPGGSW